MMEQLVQHPSPALGSKTKLAPHLTEEITIEMIMKDVIQLHDIHSNLIISSVWKKEFRQLGHMITVTNAMAVNNTKEIDTVIKIRIKTIN